MNKKWLYIGIILLLTASATFIYYEIGNKKWEKVTDAFIKKDTLSYITNLKDYAEYKTIALDRIDRDGSYSLIKYQSTLTNPEDIKQFLILAKGYYTLSKDTIEKYLSDHGELFIISLIGDVLTENQLDNYLRTILTKDNSTKYPKFHDYYQARIDSFNEKVEKKTPNKLSGEIIGRMPVSGAIEGNAGAIVDTGKEKVMLVYYRLDQASIIALSRSKDTYKEQQEVYTHLTELALSSPQYGYTFSGLVKKMENKISTNNNSYSAYTICTKDDAEECMQFCNKNNDCHDKESYKSIEARENINEIKDITQLLGITN